MQEVRGDGLQTARNRIAATEGCCWRWQMADGRWQQNPTGTRLAGRAGPAARPFARHKQSTGLFVSGLCLRSMRRLCTDSSRIYLGRSALLGGVVLMAETAGLCRI